LEQFGNDEEERRGRKEALFRARDKIRVFFPGCTFIWVLNHEKNKLSDLSLPGEERHDFFSSPVYLKICPCKIFGHRQDRKKN
jgi:hypothetical protein